MQAKASPAAEAKMSTNSKMEKFKAWWENLSFVGRILSLIVVAVLGLGPISGWVHSWWTHRQPGFDQRAVDAITLGGTRDSLEKALDREPVSVIRRDIEAGGTTLRDELYVLDTLYIEAFISDNDDVVALTFTSRTDDEMTVGRHYVYNPATGNAEKDVPWLILGKTTFVEAERSTNGLRAMGGGCGAHILNYYEVAGFQGASFNNYAFGVTTAGKLKEGTKICDYTELIDSQPLSESNRREELVSLRDVSDDFLDGTQPLRAQEKINTATISVPGVEIVQEMLAIHPDTAGVSSP